MAEPGFRQLQSEHLREPRGSQLLAADSDIDAAFSAILRHLFSPHFDLSTIYQDLKASRSGETLSLSSQPTKMATVLQQLQPAPDSLREWLD